MKSVFELIATPQEKISRNKRQQIIKEIYDIYSSLEERKFRKKENWKRYIKHCKENKVPVSGIRDNERIEKFKKNKLFIKDLTSGELAIRLGYLKEKDLFYVLSVAKDRHRCGMPVSAWLLSSTRLSTPTA
jgi:hypothetical protein